MREVLSDYARVILSVFHVSGACACNVYQALFSTPSLRHGATHGHAESLGTRLNRPHTKASFGMLKFGKQRKSRFHF